jgi:endonuclease YncB( thermonuclease family)
MRTILRLLALGVLAAGCNQPATEQEELKLEKGLRAFGYRIARVVDGETVVIDLNDQGLLKEVHLIGIDTPQYAKEFKEGGGEDAGSYLWSLISEPTEDGKRSGVYVQMAFEGWRYGPVTDPVTFRPAPDAAEYPVGTVLNERQQIEAYLFVKGHCINRLMIDSGFAWVDRKADFSRKEEFLRAEGRAQTLRLGYWQWNPPAKKAAVAAAPAKPEGEGEGEGG